MARIGGTSFDGVRFPLVLGDRYFEVREVNAALSISVFRWRPGEPRVTYEVKANRPAEDYVTTTPGVGIVTFTRTADGTWEFKLRPDSTTSVVFGSVHATDEVAVRITDREIRVLPMDILFEGGSVTGSQVGLLVSGSAVTVGVSVPHSGLWDALGAEFDLSALRRGERRRGH